MSKFTAFLFGGLVGACAALALTPRTGEQNRALVTEKANALAGEAKDFANNLPENMQGIYRSAVDQGANLVNSAVDQGSNLVNDASAKVKEATGQVTAAADSDELRDKIEAARQRIAAQVMQNAEQAKAVTADVSAATVNAVQSVGTAAAEKLDNLEEATAETVDQEESTGETADEVK